eukprot:s121_g39.t1
MRPLRGAFKALWLVIWLHLVNGQQDATAPAAFERLGDGECMTNAMLPIRGRSRRDLEHGECRAICNTDNCIGYTYAPCERICSLHGEPELFRGLPDPERWSTKNGGGLIANTNARCGSSCYVRKAPCQGGTLQSAGAFMNYESLTFGLTRTLECPFPHKGSVSVVCTSTGIQVAGGRCLRPCESGFVRDEYFEVSAAASVLLRHDGKRPGHGDFVESHCRGPAQQNENVHSIPEGLLQGESGEDSHLPCLFSWNADCKFAHGEQELRVSPSVYKTQLCNFFARGHCKKGERCRHAHGRAELREFQDLDENRIENEVYVDPGDSPETFKTPKKDSVRAPPGLQPRVLQDLSNRDLGDSPDIFTTPKKAYKENMLTSPSSLPMKVPLPGQTPLTRVPGCDSPALSWPDEECDAPANQELSSEQLIAAATAAAISAQEHAAAANALQSAAALAWARAAVDPGNSVDFDPLLALLSRTPDLAEPMRKVACRDQLHPHRRAAKASTGSCRSPHEAYSLRRSFQLIAILTESD